MMQPDRRGLPGDVQHHADSGGLHLIHDAIEPLEVEDALGGLEVVPREVTHANDVEARLLHERDVAADLGGAAVDRLIVSPHEQVIRALRADAGLQKQARQRANED